MNKVPSSGSLNKLLATRSAIVFMPFLKSKSATPNNNLCCGVNSSIGYPINVVTNACTSERSKSCITKVVPSGLRNSILDFDSMDDLVVL